MFYFPVWCFFPFSAKSEISSNEALWNSRNLHCVYRPDCPTVPLLLMLTEFKVQTWALAALKSKVCMPVLSIPTTGTCTSENQRKGIYSTRHIWEGNKFRSPHTPYEYLLDLEIYIHAYIHACMHACIHIYIYIAHTHSVLWFHTSLFQLPCLLQGHLR